MSEGSGESVISSSTPGFTFEIHENQAGLRIDQYLVQAIPHISRSRVNSSIKDGSITVNGLLKKSSYRLRKGDTVVGLVLPPAPIDVLPEEIPLQILYEDEALLAISKPPGLVVHPGSGNISGTLVSGLLYHCEKIAGVGDKFRPGLVHRLDKDTSGVMVIAKREDVHGKLVDAFKERSMEKEYRALLVGIPVPPKGRIVAPIGRHPVQRQKMAVQEAGRYAATSWQVLKEYGGYSLVAVRIETGRTHQIRVHMAHLGYPVAGDDVYGGRQQKKNFTRQMLHAFRIRFIHPITGQVLNIEAPLWADFQKIIDDFERQC